MPPDVILPRDARLVALLVSSSPSIADAQPAVLLQLLEFAHRYTSQVLSDALVYSEHAGHSGSVDEEDVKLAVQSRVGWEFGGRVPKEFLLSLAAKTNAKPLPSVPEVFGVRLPHAKHCLTAVDFDLIPNKPPPGILAQNEDGEVDEEPSDDDDEGYNDNTSGLNGVHHGHAAEDDDMEMADGNIHLFSMPGERRDDIESGDGVPAASGHGPGDEEQDEEDLFGEEEDEEMAAAEDGEGGASHPMANGIGAGQKRRADEDDDDYDA